MRRTGYVALLAALALLCVTGCGSQAAEERREARQEQHMRSEERRSARRETCAGRGGFARTVRIKAREWEGEGPGEEGHGEEVLVVCADGYSYATE